MGPALYDNSQNLEDDQHFVEENFDDLDSGSNSSEEYLYEPAQPPNDQNEHAQPPNDQNRQLGNPRSNFPFPNIPRIFWYHNTRFLQFRHQVNLSFTAAAFNESYRLPPYFVYRNPLDPTSVVFYRISSDGTFYIAGVSFFIFISLFI